MAAASFATLAQAPDSFGESIPMDKGYWGNAGQLTDPAGNPTSDAAFYSEGIYPVVFPANGSRVSFTVRSSSNDSLVPDTLLRWDLDFIGSEVQEVDPVGGNPSQDYRNFYFPHCGEAGITGVHRYGYVVYPDVYPGISFYLYTGAMGQKMAWVCEPGSDPQMIGMHFSGLTGLSIAEDGSLQVQVLGQMVQFPHPIGYQYIGDAIVLVDQQGYGYDLAGNNVNFGLGQYNPSLPLVVFIGEDGRGDMAAQSNGGVCWSTYFGGNLSEVVFGSSIGLKDDHFATGGMTSSWASFPQTPGSPAPYTTTAIRNAFVSRFSDVDELLWTTAFGGEYPTRATAYDVAVKGDTYGNPFAYIVGYTTSGNFPVQPSGTAYYDGSGTAGVEQGFIFKIDPNGYRTWATYFGNQKTQITGISKGGNELVFTGLTKSLPHEQVAPPSGSTHLSFAGGSYDAFVAMLNGGDLYNWGTYYGGSADESGMDIACSPVNKGVFYVTGWTRSANITLVNKAGAYNAGYSGDYDRFILRFDPFCVLKWASCFGGPGFDDAWYESLEVDWLGDVYLVGTTESNPFPLQPPSDPNGFYDGAYGGPQQRRGFVSRFNRTTQALEWSTFLGVGPTMGLYAVSSSKLLNGIFVGGAIDGSAPLAAGGSYWYYQPFFYPNYNGSSTFYQDAYIARFDKQNVLDWSTYFGGVAHQNEYIFSLSCPKYSPSVLAYGTTNKDANISSFFPLQASTWPLAYFDPTFNSGPYGMNDCFITRFCSGALPRPDSRLVQTAEEATDIPGLILTEGAMYRIKGIENPGILHVLSPLGQVVASIPLRPEGEASQAFSLEKLPSGTYLLQFPGLPAQRIGIVR